MPAAKPGAAGAHAGEPGMKSGKIEDLLEAKRPSLPPRYDATTPAEADWHSAGRHPARMQ